MARNRRERRAAERNAKNQAERTAKTEVEIPFLSKEAEKPNAGLFGIIFGTVVSIMILCLPYMGLEMNLSWAVSLYAISVCIAAVSFWKHAIPHYSLTKRISVVAIWVLVMGGIGFFGSLKQYHKEHSKPEEENPKTVHDFYKRDFNLVGYGGSAVVEEIGPGIKQKLADIETMV